MNNTLRNFPNGDWEVVYDRDNPRPGKIERLVGWDKTTGKSIWETLPNFEEPLNTPPSS